MKCRATASPPLKLSQPTETPGWSDCTAPQRTKRVPIATSFSSRAR
jgi:hypothetical protein